jgi:hypothetical protein
MTTPTTIRIGRLIVEGTSVAEAQITAAALRSELARLVTAEGGFPAGGITRDGGTLRAATPAGRGREAAKRMLTR